MYSWTHSCDLLSNDTKLSQQRIKAHGAKSRGNQAQVSQSPPREVTQDVLASSSCEL